MRRSYNNKKADYMRMTYSAFLQRVYDNYLCLLLLRPYISSHFHGFPYRTKCVVRIEQRLRFAQAVQNTKNGFSKVIKPYIFSIYCSFCVKIIQFLFVLQELSSNCLLFIMIHYLMRIVTFSKPILDVQYHLDALCF